MNLKLRTKGEIGEIIYPAYNGTNGFLQKSEYHIITKIDKKNNILEYQIIYDYATIRAIEIIRVLNKKENSK